MLLQTARWLAIGLVWAILITGSAFGQAKLDGTVDRILSEIGTARLLVVMAAPKTGERVSGAFVQPAAFVSNALGDIAQNVQQIVDLPIAVVETDRQGVTALVDSPQVAYVIADEPVPPLLHASLATLRVNEVHFGGTLGSDFSVAIVDTGVNYDHPFFRGKLRAEACFSTPHTISYSVSSLCQNGLDVDLTDGAGRNCDLDECDHGTHVAGIALGANVETDDGETISGVAPAAGLISIQVFTRFDSIRDCSPNPAPCVLSFPSDQLRAFRHIRTLLSSQKIASVNLSLGSGYRNAACDLANPLTSEIDRLRDSGILTVIASGNNGYYNAVNSPGCISSAITVGASLKETIELDRQYSNTSVLVDFLAPGTQIVSAIDHGFGSKDGTSMAAPHIAGLLALLLSEVQSASADTLETVLRSTAQITTDPRTGLVLYFPDAQAALDGLKAANQRVSRGQESTIISLSRLVGEKRILIQQDINDSATDPALPQIVRALGRGAIVRSLGDNTYLAESKTGFNIESLSTLIEEMGPGTRLYRDEPVPPNAH